MKISKILVPVDFSPFAGYATDYAIYFAEKYNAEITLFHAIVLYETGVDEESHVRQMEEIIRRKEKTSHAMLDKHEGKYAKAALKLRSETARGVSASDTILEHLAENDYDLIVMGTHGRTGLKNLIYGSVAEKIVRLSAIPVMTVHNGPDRQVDIKKILVPVDFSENSRKGADRALDLAKEFGAKVEFLHVIEQQLHPSFHVVGIESIFAINPDLKKISSEKLREFVPSDLESGYTVMEGSAPQTIVEYAKENKFDLIVMSTRGFTGIDHLLIGSTTERVVRLAECPVLTVGRRKIDKV